MFSFSTMHLLSPQDKFVELSTDVALLSTTIHPTVHLWDFFSLEEILWVCIQTIYEEFSQLVAPHVLQIMCLYILEYLGTFFVHRWCYVH
jgi:hypothetical protein